MTQGLYGGLTFGIPTSIGGIGGGLYIDSHGNLYPQAYYGTPRLGAAAGYTSDLEGYLTGPSVSGSIGNGTLKYNFGRSADSNGVGVGTPGIGLTISIAFLAMSRRSMIVMEVGAPLLWLRTLNPMAPPRSIGALDNGAMPQRTS